MSEPRVDLFRRGGTWRKPEGAVTVEVVLVGGQSSDGAEGEVVLREFDAADLPESMDVTVGRSVACAVTYDVSGAEGGAGGCGGSLRLPPLAADGFALVITRLGANDHDPATCRDGDHYGQCSGATR